MNELITLSASVGLFAWVHYRTKRNEVALRVKNCELITEVNKLQLNYIDATAIRKQMAASNQMATDYAAKIDELRAALAQVREQAANLQAERDELQTKLNNIKAQL